MHLLDNRSMNQISKKQNKHGVIESAIIVLLWLIAFVIPVFVYSTGDIIEWNQVFKLWVTIATFFLVFILNIYFLIPLYLKKKNYEKYILLILVITPLIICLGLRIESACNSVERAGMPPMEIGPGMPPMELSDNMPAPEGFKLPQTTVQQSVDVIFLQRMLIALLIIGTGTAYKVFFFWIEEEKQKKFLQQQVKEDNREIEEYIYVKSDLKMIKILISEIMYIESANEYIKIYLDSGDSIMTFMRLKNIETKLPENKFMRVQRSFIVNLEKIQSVEKNRIFVEQKKFIPIGQQYKEKFQEYLGKNFIK